MPNPLQLPARRVSQWLLRESCALIDNFFEGVRVVFFFGWIDRWFR